MGVITLGTGWFCLHRQLNEHWIYKDSEHLKVWLEMLMCARYHKEPKTDTYEGVLYTLNYGEFIYGRPSWSLRLGVSEQKLKTLIKKLIVDNMIVLIFKHSKFSIYKIQNFEKFNQQNNQQNKAENEGFEDICNQQNNQHLTSTQPAPNQQLTTNKQSKQYNKVNKETNKDIYSVEFEKFYESYPRPEDKRRTFNNWKTCLKTYTVDQLMIAAENYKAAKKNSELQFIKSSANFLGKEKPFEDYIKKRGEPVGGNSETNSQSNSGIGIVL